MSRASVSADKAVFDNFSAQAMLRGKTLVALTSEWLDKAEKVSANPDNASEAFRLCSTTVLKQIDTIAFLSDFVDGLMGNLAGLVEVHREDNKAQWQHSRTTTAFRLNSFRAPPDCLRFLLRSFVTCVSSQMLLLRCPQGIRTPEHRICPRRISERQS